jgi:site-specific recombinase XerD
LLHCKEQGYPRSSLKKIAWVLLVFTLSREVRKPGQITREEVEFAVDNRVKLYQHKYPKKVSASSRILFIGIVITWLRFSHNFQEESGEPSTFDGYVEGFVLFMRDERGLSPATISFRCDALIIFFDSVKETKNALDTISIKDIDNYLAYRGRHGWSRRSLRTLASALRSFFHYAHSQGWVTNFAAAIEAPPLYAQEGLPFGPSWEQVQQLIASVDSNSVTDIRDRAIILLLAVYGLRAGEVSQLHLEDIDWVGDILHITRLKQRSRQQYPLNEEVGNAIARYLNEARPCSKSRSLFLTICAPFRSLSAASMAPIVHSRLEALGIELPRRGAHCLRHACARHLLDTGFSLKQIGDQLGHRNPETTRIYAKVDLNGLRQVGEFDMGDLL